MRWSTGSLLFLFLFTASTPAQAVEQKLLDLAETLIAEEVLSRAYGSQGTGDQGLPVAGGLDVDGDGFADMAVAFFKADPFGREDAGEVDLIFGDGTLGDSIDTARDDPRLLRFFGSARRELTGSEVWIDDVTGDGLGDLILCRQNFSPDEERIGAGAITIVPGGAALRTRAMALEAVDLALPPAALGLTTLVGAEALDRLGIWVRTGDVDGDGIADLLVGADQEDGIGEPNRGAAYVVRGGPHLADQGTVDLADFGSTALAGQVLRVEPPPGSAGYHLGATCQIADLDGDGRGELLLAAALARAGASILADGALPGSAQSTGGSPDGTVYVVWGDTLPSTPWPAGFVIDLGTPSEGLTTLIGESANRVFGEELLGGLDFDGDDRPELFVGDLLSADPDGVVSVPGVGYVFYGAADLRGREIRMDSPPADLAFTLVVGPIIGALGADTAAQGDFDGDGLADLAFASPHDSPQGRQSAGSLQVLFGQEGGWPARVDTAQGMLPSREVMRITEIWGNLGAGFADIGDTLAYSATAGDMDGDGRTDLIVNEMAGNGLAPGTLDVGNLIVIGGRALEDAPVPPAPCEPTATAPCVAEQRFRVEVSWRDFQGREGVGTAVPSDADDSALFWFFDEENWEMLVKVINGCGGNDHFWVFAAATTNVEYTVVVTDTVAAVSKTYTNELGTVPMAVADTRAFATCPSPLP